MTKDAKKKRKVIGVTMGYSLLPQLLFDDGTILYSQTLDKLLYKEYWEKDKDWPHDPKTGEKLKIK